MAAQANEAPIGLPAYGIADGTTATSGAFVAPNGSVAWSSTLATVVEVVAGAWRPVRPTLNTDAQSTRVFMGTATPSSPATGDVWIS